MKSLHEKFNIKIQFVKKYEIVA